ncbi:MAG: tRNA 2-thiouridine(34) synthase MnmA [Actinomycetia bacterium]|nr:tRNA 2-thiouridine(34) synthase MnmA [Actinomycetes bacterium]MCP4959438.1 tRNA 2-thiouridine(34) synthase MnmA [Actinomycetes bacterium]
MSGGVDSSVAAALMVESGYEVEGVTLRLWGGDSDSGCCSVSDVDDARRVAQQLGIVHHVFNYADSFDEVVVTPYVEAHGAGLTPNPCIECNRHIKFHRLVERSDLLGFDVLVTGHHVRKVDVAGRPRLARSVDDTKDQSYVLHMIDEEVLARCEFPLGDMTKADVRDRAAKLGLRTAHKPESQDVCFITSTEGRSRFLGERMVLHAGELVDIDGTVVGSTEAIELITIGQRRGLDLGGSTERRYALDVDLPSRRVVVGPAEQLETNAVRLADHRWVAEAVIGPVLAQVSAHGESHSATLDGSGQLFWDVPRRRVAPGQSVVFYRDEVVLGGAVAALGSCSVSEST